MTDIVQPVPQHSIMLESKQMESAFNSMSSEKLKYIKGKDQKTFFYKILKDKKRISCYKESNAVKVNKKVNLKGAKISTENLQNSTELKILLKTGRIVVFEHLTPEQKSEIESLLNGEKKTELTDKKKKSVLKNFKKGFWYVAKAPVKLSSGTIHVLEKISDGFKKTPGTIFKNKANTKPKKPKKEVKGAAQGLYLGAGSIVTEVFGAIAGLVTEPVKGGKSGGIKGVGKGLGRGIVGLVFKPVAGSIDLVTQTARGVGTVPKTIYKGLFRVKHKGLKGDSDLCSKDSDKGNLQLVYENEKGAIYVNKEVLGSDIALSQPNPDKSNHLSEIMVNIINNLDENSKNQHIEHIHENQIVIEEQNEGEENEDQEITKIINHYEENDSEEEAEDILEILYVKNPPASVTKTPAARRASTWSIQTNSFGDVPEDDKFVIFKFNGTEKTEKNEEDSSSEESFDTESYNSSYAVNKGIPIDDSDEFDVDEFKHDELKLELFLALHTGREGRNGPDNRASIESARAGLGNNVLMNNILELLGEELDMHVEPDFIPEKQPSAAELKSAAQSPTGKTNKFFEKKPSNIGRRSRASILILRKNLDLNDMYQLLDDPEKLDVKLKNWSYPTLPPATWKEIVDTDQIRISDYTPPCSVYNKLEGKALAEFLTKWKHHEESDDVRFPHCYKKGGKIPENEVITKKMRNIAKEFLKKVGRTVLSGNFNLASVPFPIKATYPKSYLENVGVTPSSYFPLYMNLAMRSKDPIERFKFYIVGTIAYFFLATPFSKPFNPIIGETYTGHYKDGGKVYLEQISHHPPVSYMLYYGPNESYKIWGPTMFSASAGLNSIKLITKGWRKIQFGDTQQIISNTFPNEAYEGIFWGQCLSETVGDMEFVDNENNLYCKLSFGAVKKKPSDYIEGTITVNGMPVAQVSGTCLGWIEIDGMRYFDYRYSLPFQMEQENSPLNSDFRYRLDYHWLKNGYLEQGQKYKDEYEGLQRSDGKLRKEHKEKLQKLEKNEKKAKK